MSRICVFGDSIVWGYYDFQKGGWVDRLKLWYEKTGRFNQVFNLGISGDDAKKLLKRINNECLARIGSDYPEKKVIIIQIGLNDCLLLNRNSKTIPNLKITAETISQIIKTAKKFTPNIIFIGLTPVDEKRTNPIRLRQDYNIRNKNIMKVNDILIKICRAKKVFFVDLYKEWLKLDYKKFLEDGLHPNSKGHEKILENVKGIIKNFK